MLTHYISQGTLQKNNVYNNVEFWERFSSLTSGTGLDHMVDVLSTLGYTGTPRDMLRAWLDDQSSSDYSFRDQAKRLLDSAFFKNATFYKDFTNASTQNAGFTVGSHVGTFTRTACSATYIDADGVLQDAKTGYLVFGDRQQAIVGNPDDRHNFQPVHDSNIVELNLEIDGAIRKYLAYDSDEAGSEIRLYYTNDLDGTWTEYSANPILGPTANEYRWPSVVWDGTTLHMFLCDRTNTEIERWTSSDGITFEKQEDMTITTETDYMNPFCWKDPNDSKWYLYHKESATPRVLHVRSSETIAGLAAAEDAEAFSDTTATPGTVAAPSITYINGSYWLVTEGTYGGEWAVWLYKSASPDSGFVMTTNSPIYTDHQACPIILRDPTGLFTYLYVTRDNVVGHTWEQDYYKQTGFIDGGDNVPRFTQGYYDSTGFHSQPGLMIEGASTNYLKNTYMKASTDGLATSWYVNENDTNAATKTVVDATDLINLPGAQAQRIQMTFVGDATYLNFIGDATAAATFATDDWVTVSAWVKGSCDMNLTLEVIEADADSVNGTAHQGPNFATSLSTTEWRRFSYSVKCVDVDVSRVKALLLTGNPDAADTIDISVTGIQLEKLPFASSFIPTTTAAVTRNADGLKYAIAGNRTAATESIFIKLTTDWDGTTPASSLYFPISNETKIRQFLNSASTDDWAFQPNSTDSGGAIAKTGVVIAKNVSQTVVGIAYGATGDPNTGIKSSLGDLVTNNTDWIVPEWGTYFFIGSSSAAAGQISGTIQAVAFFSDAKDATDTAVITEILN